MSNQLYFINHFDGIKNNSLILSQSNINEFLTKNNLCENLIIQGKLDLLHHQFERNEVMGNILLNIAINIITYCITVSIVIFIANLLFKIMSLLIKLTQTVTKHFPEWSAKIFNIKI
jgi:hypothetical protein